MDLGGNHSQVLVRINPDNPDPKLIKSVAKLIEIGQLVVFQTDTIYGIGTNALSETGVTRLFSAKMRDQKKPVGVFVNDISELEKYCFVDDKYTRFLESIWPGTITCIFQIKKNTKLWITPSKEQPKTIAVRIPKSNLIHKLIEALGAPLIQTSVNISGQDHILYEELKKTYYRFSELMIDSGPEKKDIPSTVISLTGNKIHLLREGSTDWKDIQMYSKIAGTY